MAISANEYDNILDRGESVCQVPRHPPRGEVEVEAVPDRPNLLYFMTDNHARNALGCYGHPVVQTPNLDRIAASGVRFATAYSTAPVCCPSRAALATGRYAHQTGFWDNVMAYDGSVPSWMHRLRDCGYTVVGIGKFHYRSSQDDNGFSEEIMPMHLVDGRGALVHLLRGVDDEPVSVGQWELYLERTGIGTSVYQDYDRRITAAAVDWLKRNGSRGPWALVVSYPSPHPPFTVPKRLMDLYPADRIRLPADFGADRRSTHPAMEHLRKQKGTLEISDAEALRRVVAGYYALITHTDEQVGEVMRCAEGLDVLPSTTVFYTTDHGELTGAHGILGKFCLFEGAIGVPMLISGCGWPAGRVVDDVVSHVDVLPTFLELAGASPAEGDRALPGRPLSLAVAGRNAGRVGFAEYHATGSPTGAFLLRDDRDKLIYHVGMPRQLFDLGSDPEECRDLLAENPRSDLADRLERKLREICDPEEVDSRAKADQRRCLATWGGRDAVLKDGALVFTPPPGIAAERRPTASINAADN
jgi:choline-sulfatase